MHEGRTAAVAAAGRAALVAVVAAVVVATMPGVAAGQGREPRGRLVVKLAQGASPVTVDEVSHEADVSAEVTGAVGDDTYVVEVSAEDAREAVAALHDRVGVRWVETDVPYRAAEIVPDDPCLADCGGFRQDELMVVGAPRAWEVTRGQPAVRVAVLDTGVDPSHPELAGQVDVGPTFLSAPTDCGAEAARRGAHGTAVASVVAARTNDGGGMASLGWRTRVLSVKVLDDCGLGYASDVAAGVRWAAERVQVINLSLSSLWRSQALADAIAYAQQQGVLVVAAAGNAVTTDPRYPAALPGVLGVGASELDDRLTGFTSRGPSVDMVAPGHGVVVAGPGHGLALASGSSLSAPLVSAAAALVMAADGNATAASVGDRLTGASAPLAAGERDGPACGRLDAGAALAATAAAGAGAAGEAPPARCSWSAGA